MLKVCGKFSIFDFFCFNAGKPSVFLHLFSFLLNRAIPATIHLMKITFIYPNFADIRSWDAMQPLVFGILSTLTPPGIERVLYDERVEKIDFEHRTDLVAISVQTFTARRAYNIAERFRRRGIPVVMGGFHPTLVPDEAARYADSLVLGEGELIWPVLLEDFRQGKLQPVYKATCAWEGKGIVPDRTLFAGKKYSPLIPVQFGRGCRHRCSFCSVHSFYGEHVIQRPVEEVVHEIQSIKHSLLFFIDDNLITNFVNARRLFEALRPLQKHWACQVSMELAQDETTIALMAQAGCLAVFTGFESMNRASLNDIRKTQNLRQTDYLKAAALFKKYGIMVTGAFVFGSDNDNESVFEEALVFAMKAKLCLSHFNPLFPTPGTSLYDKMEKENRLIYPRWWLDDDYRYGTLQFYPRQLKPADVTEKCFQLRRRFNTWWSIIYRALDFKANARNPLHLGIYLLANCLSRKEIYRKQGLRLG